ASTGVVTYTPPAGYVGSAVLTINCSDGTLSCSPSTTVIVDIVESNLPPVASNGTLKVEKNGSKQVTLVATDANGDSLTYSIVSSPSSGSLTGSGNTRTYTPTWALCATENSNCSFTGSRIVRYGASGNYFYRTISGGTDCSNDVFGDPMSGTTK